MPHQFQLIISNYEISAFAPFILGHFHGEHPGFVARLLETYNFNKLPQPRTKCIICAFLMFAMTKALCFASGRYPENWELMNGSNPVKQSNFVQTNCH